MGLVLKTVKKFLTIESSKLEGQVNHATNARIIEASDKIELENASNSPFFRLPGELRNMIYSYLLPQYIHKGHIHFTWCKEPLLVSRQFRRELGGCLLDHGNFSVDTNHLDLFCRCFGYGMTKPIQRLLIYITNEVYDSSSGGDHELKLCCNSLLPLCQDGCLQSIAFYKAGGIWHNLLSDFCHVTVAGRSILLEAGLYYQ